MKIVREILPNGVPMVVQAEIDEHNDIIDGSVKVFPIFPSPQENTEEALMDSLGTPVIELDPHKCHIGEEFPFDCSKFERRLQKTLNHSYAKEFLKFIMNPDQDQDQ